MRSKNKMMKFLLILNKLRFFSPRALYEYIEVVEFQRPTRFSWSQHGEDVTLTSISGFPSIGRYLDVGANDPIRFSNTNLLYKLGWSGVNVEPNPRLFQRLQKYRVNDINLNLLVGNSSVKTFFNFKENALSTADQATAERLITSGRKLEGTTQIESVTLRSIYDRFFAQQGCDFLNIDCEGLDLEIIESLELDTLPLKRYPRWILVETLPPIQKVLGGLISKRLLGNHYELFLVLPRGSLFRFIGSSEPL